MTPDPPPADPSLFDVERADDDCTAAVPAKKEEEDDAPADGASDGDDATESCRSGDGDDDDDLFNELDSGPLEEGERAGRGQRARGGTRGGFCGCSWTATRRCGECVAAALFAALAVTYAVTSVLVVVRHLAMLLWVVPSVPFVMVWNWIAWHTSGSGVVARCLQASVAFFFFDMVHLTVLTGSVYPVLVLAAVWVAPMAIVVGVGLVQIAYALVLLLARLVVAVGALLARTFEAVATAAARSFDAARARARRRRGSDNDGTTEREGEEPTLPPSIPCGST